MADPRSIANYMLDVAAERGILLTNLALQKLLFFAYAICLVERKGKLFSGSFEAWKFGPVQPTVYEAFKASGSSAIDFRAQAFNPVTRERKPLATVEDQVSRDICDRVVVQFGRMSAGHLVDITHAEGSPWHFVVSSATRGANIGLRIPDEVIVARHGRHKISITPLPRVGEPDEDSPFV